MKLKSKIVLVPFPFDDLSSTKLRPAICLTDTIGPHRHVVMAFITSKLPDDSLDTDIFLDKSTMKNFKQTGLRVSSTIRLHRLITVSSSIIRRELGHLPRYMQNQVDEKLKLIFKLAT